MTYDEGPEHVPLTPTEEKISHKQPHWPGWCRRDWGMHSCGLVAGHEEDHLCVCGERDPLQWQEPESGPGVTVKL